MSESPSPASAPAPAPAQAPPAPRNAPRNAPRKWPLALLLILAVGLALRMVHLWALAPAEYVNFPLYASGSDMYHYWRSADVVLQGDWLGRHPYHALDNTPPAEQEKWLQRWGNPQVFHWEPLYPYTLAVLRAVDDSPLWVLSVQLLIGALTPVGVYVLGRQLANERVALIAAAVTAVYGPLLCYQGAILRDGWQPLLEPWAWAGLLWAGQRGQWWRWGLAGVAAGVCVLNKSTAALPLAAILLWMLWRERCPWRPLLQHGAYWAAGVLLALSPLIARNVIVGAPPLAISNRAAETFVDAMAADTDPGNYQGSLSRQTILDTTHSRLGPTIRLTLATYQGDWGKLLAKEWQHLRDIITPWEMPDNLAYSYMAGLSPVLWVLPGWGLLLTIGAAGWALSWVTHRRACIEIGLWLLTTGGVLLMVIVSGRYRLALLPALAIGVGLGVTFLMDAWRDHRRRRLAWGLGGILVVGLLQWRVLANHDPALWWYTRVRSMEYQMAAQKYAGRGEMDLARAELDRLKQYHPPVEYYPGFARRLRVCDIAIGEQYGWWLLHQGHLPEAYRQFEALLPLVDDEPPSRQKLLDLLAELRRLAATATAPATAPAPPPTTVPVTPRAPAP